MIKSMYENSKCVVVDGSGTTEWFRVKSCVKQGCTMSWLLFLLDIDWITRNTTTAQNKTGIRLEMMISMMSSLLSNSNDHMQNNLNNYATQTGLK